jgi:peptide methionine sulfoxide reductase MsrA
MHYPFINKGKRQYRSALFYISNDQHQIAQSVIGRLEKSVTPDYDRVYTDVERGAQFFRAEEYHQDFLKKRMMTAIGGREN